MQFEGKINWRLSGKCKMQNSECRISELRCDYKISTNMVIYVGAGLRACPRVYCSLAGEHRDSPLQGFYSIFNFITFLINYNLQHCYFAICWINSTRYFYFIKAIYFRDTQMRYDINPQGFISLQNWKFCNLDKS